MWIHSQIFQIHHPNQFELRNEHIFGFFNQTVHEILRFLSTFLKFPLFYNWERTSLDIIHISSWLCNKLNSNWMCGFLFMSARESPQLAKANEPVPSPFILMFKELKKHVAPTSHLYKSRNLWEHHLTGILKVAQTLIPEKAERWGILQSYLVHELHSKNILWTLFLYM